jgi:hypothetical protein
MGERLLTVPGSPRRDCAESVPSAHQSSESKQVSARANRLWSGREPTGNNGHVMLKTASLVRWATRTIRAVRGSDSGTILTWILTPT